MRRYYCDKYNKEFNCLDINMYFLQLVRAGSSEALEHKELELCNKCVNNLRENFMELGDKQ